DSVARARRRRRRCDHARELRKLLYRQPRCRRTHLRLASRRRGREGDRRALPRKKDRGCRCAGYPHRWRRLPLHHPTAAAREEVMNDTKLLTVGAIQCALGGSREDNVAKVIALVRSAAEKGAQIVLPPELFEGPYFCRVEKEEFFDWARPVEGHPTLATLGRLAKELGVVIPASFFERAGQQHYNSVAVFDTDGTMLGVYRKSHIPDGPGYEEKFYFRPGDTGFRVFQTKHATIGVGICWDQWFPECARAMAVLGAEIL